MQLTPFFREVAQLDIAKSCKKMGLHPVPIFHTFQKTRGGDYVPVHIMK